MATKGEALKAIAELRSTLSGVGPPGSGPANALRALLDAQKDYLADGSPSWRAGIIEEAAEALVRSLMNHLRRHKPEALTDPKEETAHDPQTSSPGAA